MWAARELKVAVSLRSGIRLRHALRGPLSSILAGRLLHVTTAASGTGPTKLRGAANQSGFGGSTDYFGGVHAAHISDCSCEGFQTPAMTTPAPCADSRRRQSANGRNRERWAWTVRRVLPGFDVGTDADE